MITQQFSAQSIKCIETNLAFSQSKWNYVESKPFGLTDLKITEDKYMTAFKTHVNDAIVQQSA